MRDTEYRIVDEPTPGPLSNLAVNPFWIFLAMMLGGAWLGWGWFLLNALAIGSATSRREFALIVGGFVGACAITFAIFVLVGNGGIATEHVKYYMAGLIALKLGVTYFVFLSQSRSFELYEYFGGQVRNGVGIVILGVVLRSTVSDSLPPFLRFVLT